MGRTLIGGLFNCVVITSDASGVFEMFKFSEVMDNLSATHVSAEISSEYIGATGMPRGQ